MRKHNQKVLVTGGAGFLGSHVTDRLLQEGYRVAVVDNLASGKKENVNPKAKFYKLDILDKKLAGVFQKEKPDTVFHFAAHIEARVSVVDPLADAKTNILGTLNVLEQCRKYKAGKILFASSGGEVYGEAETIPTPETYRAKPLSPYGVAKLAAEQYCAVYSRLFGLQYIGLRFGNVYGPRQNPNGEAGVVAIFANQMLQNKPVSIHGTGKQTKDYIFISDAIEAAMKAFHQNVTDVVNIGTGKETSVLEIFSALKKFTGYGAKAKHVPLPAIGFPRGSLAIQKAKKDLDWQPKVDLQEGLQTTVQWFQSLSRS